MYIQYGCIFQVNSTPMQPCNHMSMPICSPCPCMPSICMYAHGHKASHDSSPFTPRPTTSPMFPRPHPCFACVVPPPTLFTSFPSLILPHDYLVHEYLTRDPFSLATIFYFKARTLGQRPHHHHHVLHSI